MKSSLTKLVKSITKVGLITVIMMICLYPAVSNALVVVARPGAVVVARPAAVVVARPGYYGHRYYYSGHAYRYRYYSHGRYYYR